MDLINPAYEKAGVVPGDEVRIEKNGSKYIATVIDPRFNNKFVSVVITQILNEDNIVLLSVGSKVEFLPEMITKITDQKVNVPDNTNHCRCVSPDAKRVYMIYSSFLLCKKCGKELKL